MATATLNRGSVLGSAPIRARWATVRVETDTGVYVGRVFVPETRKRLSDMLCDERPFLNLAEVSMEDSDQIEPYVAINKRFVRTVRVLDEGMPVEALRSRPDKP